MSDRIYALGHSEGTLTAMHLSLRRRDVAGMIQLCPTAEDCEPALLRQAGHVRDVMRDVPESGDPVASQRNLIERVRTQHAEPHELESHYIGLKWFREVLDLDVRELYAKMARPMLLIAGAKDVGVDPAEVPGLREITPAPVEIHVVPNLTHVLRLDQEQPSILRYSALIQDPVEPLVLSLISRWLVQAGNPQIRRCRQPGCSANSPDKTRSPLSGATARRRAGRSGLTLACWAALASGPTGACISVLIGGVDC